MYTMRVMRIIAQANTSGPAGASFRQVGLASPVKPSCPGKSTGPAPKARRAAPGIWEPGEP